MYPKLFTLPGGITITTYGFFLMVGFLSAVWLAMRRAARVKADPDRVLDVSFFALVFGVGGARLMYVVHYWRAQFADAPNQFFAIIDIRQGGLEFLGGLLGAAVAIVVYLLITRQSIRLYLDILAPGAMWGLAFGRLGCFFNGCCFGGICTAGAVAAAGAPAGVGHDHPVWAVQFPYGSPAHIRQWEDRQATVPAELITTRGLYASLLPADVFRLSEEERTSPINAFKETAREIEAAKGANRDPKEIRRLEAKLAAEERALDARHLGQLLWSMRYPSRQVPERPISVSELEDLAAEARPHYVHATQLYAAIHAFLLCAVLTTVFYRRKRHGVVIGLLFLLYPFARIPEEIIRADNPQDVAGLTISQALSVGLIVAAAAWLYVLYRHLPETSPAAARARPAEREKTGDS